MAKHSRYDLDPEPEPTPQSAFVPPEYPYRLYHISSRPDDHISTVVTAEEELADLGEGWGAAEELPFDTAPDGPPAPVLLALVPDTVTLGAPSFAVHVTGAGYVTGSVIVFNGFAEPTTVASPHDLTTVVNMDVWQAAAEVPVWVRNPDGQESAPLPFTFVDVPAQLQQTWHAGRSERGARRSAGPKGEHMPTDTPKTPSQPTPPTPKPGPEPGGREDREGGGGRSDREGGGRGGSRNE